MNKVNKSFEDHMVTKEDVAANNFLHAQFIASGYDYIDGEYQSKPYQAMLALNAQALKLTEEANKLIEEIKRG